MSTKYAYLAGIIDGEGTITLSPPRGVERRSVSVSVTSTTPELTTWLHANFGGRLRVRKARKPNHRTPHVWTITHRAAVCLLALVEPYLVITEKRRRAALIREAYATCVPRNGRYSITQLAQREAFEASFFVIPVDNPPALCQFF